MTVSFVAEVLRGLDDMKRVSLTHKEVLEWLKDFEAKANGTNEISGYSVDRTRRVIWVTDDAQTGFCTSTDEYQTRHEYRTADGWKVIIRVFGCKGKPLPGYSALIGLMDTHVVGGVA